MKKFNKKDIDDYQNRITDEQATQLIDHCNEFYINPVICAWYEDMDDFYVDWVIDNQICKDEKDADDRYAEGLVDGEFKKFYDGKIVRLSL